jgi:acyl-CoA synthetase (AMP-forming)/AMP-acid ligase II
LEERANRCAQMLRDFGLAVGDHIAAMMENRPAFYEVFWAAQRAARNCHANTALSSLRRGQLVAQATSG